MTIQEVDKLLTYLVIAYPNSKPYEDARTKKAFITAWHDTLKTFPYNVGQEAVKDIISAGSKFFPSLGELIIACDEVWQKHERIKREENEQAERDATHLLFSEPLDKIDRSMGRIAKLSVALVRDVCNDKIKYQSPEWDKRQSEIERLAGVATAKMPTNLGSRNNLDIIM